MKYKAYIEELKGSGIVPGLDRIRQLLSELGDPQEKISCIHVAGTNGKGSVCAMLSAILTESGRKAGRFNSPAVTCYHEIIRIGEDMITDEELEYYYDRIHAAAEILKEKGLGAPTLFEAETAIAFSYFADQKVDYAILECGMGGLLDATNIIREPLLAIITSVDYDHMTYLGNHLTEIARNKAGIIKQHTKCVLSPEITDNIHGKTQDFVDLRKIFEEKAQEVDAVCIGADMKKLVVTEEGPFASCFIYDGISYQIPMAGTHQIRNAITAILAAKEVLSHSMDPDDLVSVLQHGIARTRWPGRLEKIGECPLIIRDGAHNPAGARMLSEYLKKHFSERRIIFVTGILKDKDYPSMIEETIELADKVYVFTPGNARGLDAAILKAAIIEERSSVPVIQCPCMTEALSQAIREADQEDVIILWGSLSFMMEWSKGKC